MTAFLIPENIASRSDLPPVLRSVAEALRDFLPDEVTVWLEGEDTGQPFWLVLDPASGVLILDAPDVGGVRRLLDRWSKVPLEELRRHIAERHQGFANELRGRAAREHLLGNRLPIAVAIAAPLLDRARLAVSVGRSSGLPPVLTKEDLQPTTLREAIRRAIATAGGAAEAVANEAAARAVLHPEIVIGRGELSSPGQLVFRPLAQGDEDTLRVLDRQQERLARRLDGGYRVIRGVAGSGKTLVLTYRARFLAEAFPQWSILLTCYNVCLAKALEHELQLRAKTTLPPNVTVRNIDSLALSLLRKGGRRAAPRDNSEWVRLREEAVEVLTKDRSLATYDAVLVDEAQDFDATGLELAWRLLRDGRDHFVIARDDAQNIYRKQGAWNPPGLTARGRTTVLKLNYRNTREILEFAWRFLAAGDSLGGPNDESAPVPPEAAARMGVPPDVITCAGRVEEVRTLVDLIVKAHKQGTPWGDMAVIVGHRSVQGRLYYETQRRGVPYFWVPHSPKTKRQVAEHSDKVRAFTIQAAKGLEFKHVFFCAVNDIYDPGAQLDPLGRRRLAYVAMTRATDRLTILVSGNGEIGRAIIEAHAL